MAELTNRYQQIMDDIRSNVKDEEEKEFVLSKFQELSLMFIDVVDRVTSLTDLRVKEVEAKQKEINEKMDKIQNVVDGIENDIYEDCDSFEFEIICPYCNHEFVTDINAEFNTEVQCPECHNMIELDWNCDDEECGADCSHCSHECVAEDDEEYDEIDENLDKTNNDETEQDDEDM